MERAIRLGFDRSHALPAVTSEEEKRKPQVAEDRRFGLLGSSFLVPCVARLCSNWQVACGKRAQAADVDECWGLGDNRRLMKRCSDSNPNSNVDSKEMVAKWLHSEALAMMHRGTIFRGSDVRIGTGTMCDPRVWPRKQVESWLWKCQVVLSCPLEGSHTNALEMQAILTALKWRLRKCSAIKTRFVHLTDGLVCMAILAKGRTRSRVIQRIVRRVNALILSGSLVAAYGHTRSRHNPADRPSRWRHDPGISRP